MFFGENLRLKILCTLPLGAKDFLEKVFIADQNTKLLKKIATPLRICRRSFPVQRRCFYNFW